MDNGKEGDIPVTSNNPESTRAKIWSAIRNFGRKRHSEQPHEARPNETATFETHAGHSNIIAEDKSLNNVNDQSSESLVEAAPTVENLRPAPRLFFHTTPASNLEGIKQKGLIAQGEKALLGRVLGYSLHFGEEHQERYQGPDYLSRKMKDRLETLPDDYVMTIWDDNEEIKKKYFGEYTVTQKTELVEDANDYLNQVLGASPYQYMSQEEYDSAPKAEYRKLSPDHLRAAIPLDRETRELFIKQMILSEKGFVTADQIEKTLADYLNTRQMWNADETLRDETIHGLVASLEHSLIRGAVTKRIEVIKKQSGGEIGTRIKKALEATIILQSMINDPLSARYLDSAKKFLIEQLTALGQNADEEIEQTAQKMKARVETPERSDVKYFSLMDSEHQIEFWGATNTEYAQYLYKQKMGYG